ncbi:myotubularin, putative [Entamoeba histolytica HM-1:IMSS-B]|uniref:Myotubularin-related protein 2, putative n=6 Tax=Entamoeba histolytica TaxID=5759 RepID=C4M4M0_ENTH1|nr:myotubularin-related protein 2, putative [Entamoeba histolytica HM-1:IMSS]EMD47733.1 myotubularin-related protein, putative [Entamoeba histolytica KU27]EMH75408.1 myotubularin, putative [Entamoeba histolytica HM-1:IMSS-B]EMS14040.1 myotubularin-related protein 2, putative [Entamoeba histolytica HM-3:IMSS]ENY64886.1 myotubularin-related protein 2, putative [Entamoeba histolytica HM-1:IMSS-A]GAT96316.1 myotubularin putative [Entamoeba histolytica]|eukprot:XP_654089.1 myotubularin-related protein 2, putative [Entamoeba histolytica HM-1:IMSS]
MTSIVKQAPHLSFKLVKFTTVLEEYWSVVVFHVVVESSNGSYTLYRTSEQLITILCSCIKGIESLPMDKDIEWLKNTEPLFYTKRYLLIFNKCIEKLLENPEFMKELKKQKLLRKDFLPPLNSLKFTKKGKVLFHRNNDPEDLMIDATLMLCTSQLPYLYVYITNNPVSIPYIAIQLPPILVQLSQQSNGAFIIQTPTQSYVFYVSMVDEANKWVHAINKSTIKTMICPKGLLALVNSPRSSPKSNRTPKKNITSKETNGILLLTSYNNETNSLQKKILKDQLRLMATINITGLIQTLNERHIIMKIGQLKHVLSLVLFGTEISTLENVIGEIGFFSESGLVNETIDINELHGSVIFALKEDSKIPNLHGYSRNLDGKEKSHILLAINRMSSSQNENKCNIEYPLFPGENIISIIPETIHLHFNQTKSSVQPIFGTVIVTTARFIFKHQKQLLEIDKSKDLLRTSEHCSGTFHVPVPSIKKIKVRCIELESIKKFYTLLIITKYFNYFYIGYFTDEAQALKLQETLLCLIEKNAQIELFSMGGSIEDRMKLIREDFTRLNIEKYSALKVWTQQLCPTYPPCVVIPSIFNEEELQQCVQFRSKGRIPIVSWISEGNGLLVRSSQPATGITSSRSKVDEQMLTEYAMMSRTHSIKVYDARPKLNANVNRVKGMGSENMKNYGNATITFLNIDNIHKMRDAEDGLFTIIESPLNEENKNIWLKHIKKIIKGVCELCSSIINGNSVLVHCSDGWDRTSQLTSLTMIIMDPYYRTFKGFETIIEKEWSLSGHKFSDRCRHLNGSQSISETSPIFLQFIDSVYQLYSLFPSEFEFNEVFLKELLFQLYSCYFCNFRFNCWNEFNSFGNRVMNFYSFLDYEEEILFSFSNELFNPQLKVLPLDVIKQKQPIFWYNYYGSYSTTHNYM